MQRVDKKRLKKFYEEEAKHLSHQEIMYLKGDNHELWWHRKRLYYIVSSLSEIFKKNQIMTFADIGCAEGFYVKHIASIHNETFCIGVDIARAYIKKAKSNGKTLNTAYIVCDVENLPFKDNSINVVLCSEVLEHVYNYHGSLAELCRVGKKYLVLSFPGHSYIYKAVSKIKHVKKLADNIVRAPDVGHVSEVKVSDVQKFLKGKCKCLKIKIGGTLPLMLFEIIPSVRLVDVIDNMICKVLEYFGAVDYTTIHVIEIVKDEN
jgi:ubiquinone/menaquinone biosynthesis C-methylase UbiE